MEKRQVLQIGIDIRQSGQTLLRIEIGRDGRWMRSGTGMLPEVAIGAECHSGSSALFNQLLAVVPQKVLERSMAHEELTGSDERSWMLCFIGPEEKIVLHFRLSPQSSFRDPLLNYIESFAQHALEKTNSWYFDAVVLAVYRVRANDMAGTRLILPDAQGLRNAFEHYINQVCYGPRRLDLLALVRGKTYCDAAGRLLEPRIWQQEQGVYINFVPPGSPDTHPKESEAPALPDGTLRVAIEQVPVPGTEPAQMVVSEPAEPAPTLPPKRPWWKFW